MNRYGLYQQQTLKLALTQELKQSIELLQYSSYELTTFLEEKAAENPLIELKYVARDDLKKNRSFNNKTKSNDSDWIQNIGSKQQTLENYLIQQIPMKNITSFEKKVLLYLIGNLDHNGYLTIADDDVCSRFSIDLSTYHHILNILQSFEPAGIGARNLQECLLIQLKRETNSSALAIQIIENHFELFAEKKWKKISTLINVSLSNIQAVYDKIQTLHPRPGSMFDLERSSYIIPDFIVKETDGQWVVQLVEYGVPQLELNEQYDFEWKSYEDTNINRFLSNCKQEFNWLKKSLEQRKLTMVKVMEKIIEYQGEFFQHGFKYLKPLTMKQIAEDIDMHESTVSRVVKNKFVQTPFGTIPLKDFFPSGVQSEENEQTSDIFIKQEIQRMVDQEDKRKPISDQQMVEQLKKKGIHVSRRTIAKYRSQLGILSSSKRKRYE